jgi:hypothetical protein
MAGNELLGLHQKLQSGATTGNGSAVQLNGLGREVTFYIIGSAGISAGAVQLEEAHDQDYTGTWAPIGAAQTVTAGAVKVVHSTGCVGAVRARISTNIVDGTVTVEAFAN